jgi:putrescine aminotransferase
MRTAPDVDDIYQAHLSRGLSRIYRLLGLGSEVRAEGPWVWSSTGKRYLDFGGFGVFLLGHRHPHIVSAVQNCLSRTGLSSRAMANPFTASAAEALARSSGGRLEKVTFASTGAEAVEFAMKVAVRATGRGSFAALEGGFHGKTLGALSLTHAVHYREPWAHVLHPVRHFRPGDDELFAYLRSESAAALVMEPIQSENGVTSVDPAWLSAAARAASASGTVVVVDEVSTGCGRTGDFWRSECGNVLDEVDVLVAGKALGGGVMPIAAALVRSELYEPFDVDPLLHTSTFAGNPLAAAAASATIELLDSECLADIRRKGLRLVEAICGVAGEWPLREARGAGLLLGLEFESVGACGYVARELMLRGMLTVPALGQMRTLRLTPSAVITDGQIDFFADSLSDSLKAARHDREFIENAEG